MKLYFNIPLVYKSCKLFHIKLEKNEKGYWITSSTWSEEAASAFRSSAAITTVEKA